MKRIALALLTVLLLIPGLSQATTFDFDAGINGTTQLYTLTSFQGTIETQDYGLFTSELDIENFLNSSLYSFNAYIGDSLSFTLDNSNSTWDLMFGGPGGSIEMISSEDSLSVDFFTPNEISSVALLLRNNDTWDTLQLRQSNNVFDQNFFHITSGDLMENIYVTQAYDTAYSFPAVAPVPEPASLWLLGFGLLALAGYRTRFKSNT